MKIQRVDVRHDSVKTRLSVLQKKCLPYDKAYDVSNGYWWIATKDGVDCGFAGLVYSSRWSDCGYLVRCGVLPSHRGFGLQKKFIRVRIRQAKALGLNWSLAPMTIPLQQILSSRVVSRCLIQLILGWQNTQVTGD